MRSFSPIQAAITPVAELFLGRAAVRDDFRLGRFQVFEAPIGLDVSSGLAPMALHEVHVALAVLGIL